jgi:hypothetical protein
MASEKQEITGELLERANAGYGISNGLRKERVLAGRKL